MAQKVVEVRKHYDAQIKKLKQIGAASKKEITKLYELLQKRKTLYDANIKKLQELRENNSVLESENRKLLESSSLLDRSLNTEC